MPQLNQRDAVHYIATREEFKASALTGSTYSQGCGRLNLQELDKFINELTSDKINFFVYSYGTPIAWHTDAEGWYVVSQKFSVTTSKHQNLVRRAIAESLAVIV
jgi:hypothetical protein